MLGKTEGDSLFRLLSLRQKSLTSCYGESSYLISKTLQGRFHNVTYKKEYLISSQQQDPRNNHKKPLHCLSPKNIKISSSQYLRSDSLKSPPNLVQHGHFYWKRKTFWKVRVWSCRESLTMIFVRIC